MKKIWIAYFATTEARKSAQVDAEIEGIDILIGGIRGQKPNQEQPFIIFQNMEEKAVEQVQFFSENGATDVQQIL